MIKRLLTLLLFVFTSITYADVIINAEYKYDIFNLKLKGLDDLTTFGTIEKALEEQYGFKIVNKILELNPNKKIYLPEKEKIGDILNEVIKGYEASVDVDGKKGVIYINQLNSFFVQMPFGWDMHHLKESFVFSFNEVEYKINGTRLYVYGSKSKIEEIRPTLLEVERLANRKQYFQVIVYPYSTNENAKQFIGYMKNLSPLKESTPLSQTVISLTHNGNYGFVFQGEFIQLKMNLINETIEFSDELYVKFDQLYDLGYVFHAFNGTYIVRVIPEQKGL